MGGPIQENKDKVRDASPLTYVSKDDPPFLIVHGTEDPLVAFNQSEQLDAAMRRANVDVTFIHVKGAGHGGFDSTEVLRRVGLFFEKHLRGQDVEIKGGVIDKGQPGR